MTGEKGFESRMSEENNSNTGLVTGFESGMNCETHNFICGRRGRLVLLWVVYYYG